MQATTVKLHSLGYDQAKTYWIAALFVAGNVIFLIYDYAFSKVMSLIQARLIPQLRRRFVGR